MSVDPRMIFLESKNVILKVLEESDLLKSNWAGWFNDVERCENNSHHKYPNSWDIQRMYLESRENSKVQLGVVAKRLDTEICGVVSLQDIDLLHGNCHLAIMLDKSCENNPEIFIESISLLLAHGFNELRMNKICVGSLDERLIPSLAKLFNFKLEGILVKQLYKSGQFRDIHVGAVFAEEVVYRHEH